MKKCPYCAEEIQEEAIFCRYCRHDLRGPVDGPPRHTPGLTTPPSASVAKAPRSLWGEAVRISAVLYGISLVVAAIRVTPYLASTDDLAPYAGLLIGAAIAGFLLHIPLYAAVLAIWRRIRKTRDLPSSGCRTYASIYVGGILLEVIVGLLLVLLMSMATGAFGRLSPMILAGHPATSTPHPPPLKTPTPQPTPPTLPGPRPSATPSLPECQCVPEKTLTGPTITSGSPFCYFGKVFSLEQHPVGSWELDTQWQHVLIRASDLSTIPIESMKPGETVDVHGRWVESEYGTGRIVAYSVVVCR